ncbi:Uncharacterised protein [Aeromonas encheleia]|uniref:type III secretion system chaperone n=1 Tax=Aeromonas encheleia TaxID=73010 RepID=UPI000AD0E721|nr:type III secretion system chaperone [Aeromonas encheleia]VEG97288.1 Uncharacterised protein [Aeromonas encheleia]
MDLNTRLTRLARQLDVEQLNQLSADEWLLLTDELALQITRTDTGMVLACSPNDLELDARWLPLLLGYNGLLTTTGGVVMGLTGNQRLVMQLPITDADDEALASVTHNFLQLVREWQQRLMQPCQTATPALHSMTMISAIKG